MKTSADNRDVWECWILKGKSIKSHMESYKGNYQGSQSYYF